MLLILWLCLQQLCTNSKSEMESLSVAYYNVIILRCLRLLLSSHRKSKSWSDPFAHSTEFPVPLNRHLPVSVALPLQLLNEVQTALGYCRSSCSSCSSCSSYSSLSSFSSCSFCSFSSCRWRWSRVLSVQPMRQLVFLWIFPASGNCCRSQTAASQSMIDKQDICTVEQNH